MAIPHVPWNKPIWILSLWIYLLTDVCIWVDGIRSPEVRRAGAPGSQFVTNNRLAESDGPAPLDYDALLERINGDFGIRSDVVEAAGQEPEYHGADTLVVPLYIPEGAVPINLARIARSGTPEPDVELVDMEVSPSSDSLLIRRIGPVSDRRTSPPRRPSWRPTQRPRPVRLPAIRRSDLVGYRPSLSTTTPEVPPVIPPLAGFGQRLSPPNHGRLVAVQRLTPHRELPHSEEDVEDNNKRAKKNELSKDSQFHDFHTSENSAASSSSTSKTPTSTSETTTAGKPRSTIKFPKRLTVSTTTPTTIPTTTTTTTTTTTSTTTTTTTPATTTTDTTTTSTTTTPTTTTKPTPQATTTDPETTTTSTTTAKSDISVTTTLPSTTKVPDASTSTTVWDRRSVLFPKPVESILGSSTPDVTTYAASTTTAGTTTTTTPTTTTTTTTTTTERPSSTSRSPIAPLRSLPPWLSRTISSSTTAKSQLIIDELTQDIKTRTTESPIRTTTDRIQFATTEKIMSSTSQVPVSTTESPYTTSKRTIIRPVIAPVERPIATERATTEKSTTESTTTVVWTPVITKRPVIIPQRSSPLKMMLSVDEILKESRNSGDTEDIDGIREIPDSTVTRSSLVTQPSVSDERHKITIIEDTVAENDSSKFTIERTEKDRQWKWPLLRYSEANREERPIETVSEPAVESEESVLRYSETGKEIIEPSVRINKSDKNEEPLSILSELIKEEDEEQEAISVTEHENTSTVTAPRKIWRRPRPHPENKDHAERDFDHSRPGRRRRPGRPRTSPAPITQLSDFFKIPKETLAVSTTKQDHTTTEKVSKTTLRLSTTTLPTPTTTTEKSPEQIVIESLTEIMKDATNNNKSKDKVSNIATNLEALNKQLAERGIHIIHAEVDGVRIKLDNRTLSRHTTAPTPTTFHPPTEFKVTFTPTFSTSTEQTSTSLVFPSTEGNERLVIANAKTEEELEKDVSTSVRTSFSIHTSDPTDIENETDSENEVQSTTNDSTFTTFKPTEIRKLTTKPIRGETHSPVLSASMLPSSEDVGEDTPITNNTRPESNPETPVVEETLPPIRTSSPAGSREKEGEESNSASSVAIFASSTVPASVTTRTRSTTVPITTHRPSLRPFLSNSRDRTTRPEVITADETTLNSNTSSEDDNTTEPEEQQITTSVHPTSHHRPTSVPKLLDKPSSSEASVDSSATKEFGFNTFSYATVQEDTPPTPSDKRSKAALDTTTTSTSTTRRPVIEVISITKEIQDAPFAPESVAAAEEVESEDFTESSSSASTTVYAIGVIGIIPAAGLAAFLAKKFLRKTQKALPDSEERAEGFTPVTHHSRKPSQSNTLDVESSSVEAKNPKYSPWEFPRSKLRLVSVLGEGNFGVVWKAEARELCACEGSPGGPTVLVAVKGVKDGAGVKERQDLLKELAIMQHIGQHPNIVTLLGCCTQQEPHYLVMEYVMFGKLLTFLRDHRTRHNYYNFSSDTEALTSRDLTRFACQIATGCDYLQTRGIIHRDLAARNILVDHNKVCKIADFGLARNVKDLGSDIYEQKSRGALPIRWMAPESLYMSIFTHKSDVWSLGILCWEIVTLGSTPYPGMTAREVMRRVREGYRLERPEHCRPEFYHIVTKCWHQDLNKRPTFSELKLEMSKLLDHGHMAYPCIDLENFPEANYFSMHDNEDEKL